MSALPTIIRTPAPYVESGATNELIGTSSGLQQVRKAVQLVARTDSAVLIQGETGTGKELVARAIHEESLRKLGPYVKVNCAAMPSGLLESELFGHERGALTGALGRRLPAVFNSPIKAHCSWMKSATCRWSCNLSCCGFSRSRNSRDFGSARARFGVDVRVVAATNQDLAQNGAGSQVQGGPVLPAQRVPDRHSRAERALGRYSAAGAAFCSHVCAADEQGRAPRQRGSGRRALRLHDWPGNIRELQNIVERAVIMSSGPELQIPFGELKHLVKSDTPAANRTLAEAERDHIIDALRQVGWVVGGREWHAAARLGLARTTLLYRMRKLGIAHGAAAAAATA